MADNKVGEAFVELRYQLSRLSTDFRAVERTVAGHTQSIQRTATAGLSRLGGALTAPFRQLGGMMSGLQNQAATLAGAFGGIAVGAGIVQTNVEFERLHAVLKTVTGSVDAGAKAFTELEKFAAQTPFTLEQAVQGFARLKALGIEPTMERMRAFGNVSAAMGTDLMQFVEAVADASTGEFERLKEFGVRASAEGERVSFTFQGVTTTVGRNAAEIAAYLENIGKVQFGTAMADQMGALPGLFSNLQDTAASFARQIGEGGLNQGLKDIARSLLDMQSAAGPFAETLGQLAGGALARLSEALKGAMTWFNGLSPQMQDFTVKAAAFGTALAAAVPVMALFIASIGAIATPLGAAVIGIAAAGAAFVTFNDEINAFLAGSWQNIQRDFETVKNAATALGESFQNFAKTAINAVGGIPAPVASAMGRVTTSIEGVLNRALAASRDAGAGFRTALSEGIASGDYAGMAARFAGPIATALNGLLEGARTSGTALREVVEGGLNGTLAAVQAFGTAIRAAIEAALNGVLAIVQAAGERIRTGITAPFKDAATASIDEVRRMVSGVREWLSKPWDLSGVKANVESVKGFFSSLYMSVVGGSIVPDMVNEVGGWMSRLGPLMVQPVAAAAADVKSRFEELQAASRETMAEIALTKLPLPPAFEPIDIPSASPRQTPSTAPGMPAKTAAAPAAPDAEAEARQRKIADLRYELEALQRLTAAQAESAAAGERMRITLEAERAAREMGSKATAAQRDEVSRLTRALAEQEGAGERAQAIAALKIEIDELTRLTAAQNLSAEAGQRVQWQIEAERAARALGATATAAEIEQIKSLTVAKLEQAAALDKATEARQKEQARLAEYNAQFAEIEAEAAPKWSPTLLGSEEKRTHPQGPRIDFMASVNQMAAGADAALRQYVENATNYGKMAGDAIATGLRGAEDAIVGFALKGESVFDSLKSVVEDLTEQFLRMAVRQSMAMMIMGMGLGGPAAAPAGAGAGGFARGGVFVRGRVQPFARGGIVSKPTIFPMAKGMGLMGEAGAEAIMPLRRTAGGKLGVEAADGGRRGGNVTVNVTNNAVPAEQVSTRETTSPDGGRQIEVMIERAVNKQLSSGRMDRAMRARYGAQPAAR